MNKVVLTHVASAIGFANLADVQAPRRRFVLDTDARIVRHNLLLQTEDRLVIRTQPDHLQVDKQINLKLM